MVYRGTPVFWGPGGPPEGSRQGPGGVRGPQEGSRTLGGVPGGVPAAGWRDPAPGPAAGRGAQARPQRGQPAEMAKNELF